MSEQPAEARIRAAMQQLLAGPIPDNLKCDIKSLCVLAGIPRATFYRLPHLPHLKAEFDQQRNAAQLTGQQPDPRLARIQRLKAELETLRQRLNTKNAELANLKQLQSKALSQSPPSTTRSQHSVNASTPAQRSRHSRFPVGRLLSYRDPIPGKARGCRLRIWRKQKAASGWNHE